MNEEVLRELIQERWTELEAEQTAGERSLRVAELPVVVDQGPLAVAVDREGHRHVLVPIQANRKLRTGLDGPGLQLRRRALEGEETYQVYADLACRGEDLDDLFTELCVDVLGETEDLPANPVKALYRVLDRWRALFRTRGTRLGPDQIAGLFGELLVLERLLAKDPSAHRLWRGPQGHPHDFSNGTTAVEVKSSTADTGRRPRIHGFAQLEAPSAGTLSLAWFGLRRTTSDSKGVALVELIDRLVHMCDDEKALLALLARVGYLPLDVEQYRDVRFVIGEERWYRVDADFPRLTGQSLVAGVPALVSDVSYTIDLSGETIGTMGPGEVSRTVDELIQESV
ncbi:PD-(D/E)XK motif protein [Streptomyces sp. NPDC054956]